MKSLGDKYLPILFTIYFLLHCWTALIAYSAHGIGSAVLAFFMPVLPDIYWGSKVFMATGFNVYSSALIVFALVFAFLFSTSVKRHKNDF